MYGLSLGKSGNAVAMPATFEPNASLDFVTHVIQLALTPVFLLSGIATLLNVFSTRLARISDRVDQVTKAIETGEANQLSQLASLRRRSLALDIAVILGAVGAAATCASVLVLFVGALKDAAVAALLLAMFGLAVVCALGAIGAFTAEMLMTGSGVRATAAADRRAAVKPLQGGGS